jgi:hypothetical protein
MGDSTQIEKGGRASNSLQGCRRARRPNGVDASGPPHSSFQSKALTPTILTLTPARSRRSSTLHGDLGGPGFRSALLANLIRNNAWNSGGDFDNADLLWYAKGVGKMMGRALDDPASWWFFAAMHGEYVGGAQGVQAVIPPAFGQKTLPDGSANPLYVAMRYGPTATAASTSRRWPGPTRTLTIRTGATAMCLQPAWPTISTPALIALPHCPVLVGRRAASRMPGLTRPARRILQVLNPEPSPALRRPWAGSRSVPETLRLGRTEHSRRGRHRRHRRREVGQASS